MSTDVFGEECVTCSWQSSPLPYDICDDLPTAMACVESIAAARESNSAVSLSDPTAAPWIALRMPRAVRGVAVACSARVLEIHVGTGTVHTHEGSPAGDLFIHRAECDAAAGETVLLKFFARRPKGAIDVAALGVACEQAALGSGDEKSACGGTGGGLAERLERLEAFVYASVGPIVRQLSGMEKRLQVLEAERNH